mgnify:CR=1 FL=1
MQLEELKSELKRHVYDNYCESILINYPIQKQIDILSGAEIDGQYKTYVADMILKRNELYGKVDGIKESDISLESTDPDIIHSFSDYFKF